MRVAPTWTRRLWAAVPMTMALLLVPSLDGIAGPKPHPVSPQVSRSALSPISVEGALADGAPVSRPGAPQPSGSVRSAASASVLPITTRVAVVGLTWTGGPVAPGDGPEVRIRTGDVWGPWEALDTDQSESAEPTERAGSQRAGTSARAVIGAAAVETRWLSRSGRLPGELTVNLVDPGQSDADASAAAPLPGAARADATRPTIHSRAEWGADESLVTSPPEYAQAHLVFVHHTAGVNDYQPGDVPSILRGILAFHVLGRGWNDIGYNALVDKFGTIWEGRAGGLDQAVIGAHTLGHNQWSFGVSVLGDYTATAPTTATLDALARYIAWKFSLHGDPVYGQVYANDGWFNRISGHRDGQQTTCPGQLLYDQLPAVRSRVAALVGQLSLTPLVRSVDADPSTDVLVYPVDAGGAATGPGVIGLGAGPVPISTRTQVGSGWSSNLTDVALSRDLTGDVRTDLIAVERTTGTLRIYAGNGAAGVSSVQILAGFGGYDLVIPAGDRDGDGKADLLARGTNGDLFLLRGIANRSFSSPRKIGSGWGGVRILAPGEITGDGIQDVLLISATGELWVYPGLSDGGFTGARFLRGSGWQELSVVTTAGDLDGDGIAGDLLGRDSVGRMHTYYASSSGSLSRTNTWGSGWDGIGTLTAGDWDGDGTVDLLGTRPSDGALLMYRGTGLRDFVRTRPGPDVPGANLVRLVGDVNGDGYSDAVARVADGELMGLWGQPPGGFSAPFRIGTGWQSADIIAAIGDYTRDGVPDLVLRLPSSGRTICYPMTRTFGFLTPMPFDSGWTDLVSITTGGRVNGDANLDLVVLDKAGTLWLEPGSGPSSTMDRITLLTGQTDLVQLLGVGDITGDGWPDLLARTTGGKVVLYPGNTGATFSPTRSLLRGPWALGTTLG